MIMNPHFGRVEIRGVLVPAGEERLLLPNATVAEVLSQVGVEPIAGAPAWLRGHIAWQGWRVPLVSFAALAGMGDDTLDGRGRIVVLKALGGNPDLPYIALLTPAFPRLASVPHDGLLADATEEPLPDGVQMRVLLGDETALLPDLDRVEQRLVQALAAVQS